MRNMDQHREFFDQYLEDTRFLRKQFHNQGAPRLRHKKLFRTWGTCYTTALNPEQGSEFVTLSGEGNAQLRLRYKESLSKSKDELQQFV